MSSINSLPALESTIFEKTSIWHFKLGALQVEKPISFLNSQNGSEVKRMKTAFVIE